MRDWLRGPSPVEAQTGSRWACIQTRQQVMTEAVSRYLGRTTNMARGRAERATHARVLLKTTKSASLAVR